MEAILDATDKIANSLEAMQHFFWEKGYLVINNVLSASEIEFYLEKIEKVPPTPGYHQNSRVRIFEQDYSFVQLLEKEPVISLMRLMLGNNLHIITQMIHVMEKGTEVLKWHIDENYLPIPSHYLEGKELPPIINTIHCHYYLVDVPIEMGPTLVVPHSHTSFRAPNESDGNPPTWKKNGPVPLIVKAGDCVLYSNQLWHCGSPNLTQKKRFSIVNFYARRFVAQRLYPFVNYQIPENIFIQCTESQKQLLGAHPIGKIYG